MTIILLFSDSEKIVSDLLLERNESLLFGDLLDIGAKNEIYENSCASSWLAVVIELQLMARS